MDYKQELEKRIRADYKRRVKQWMASDPAQLIDMAEEIIATRLIHDNLLDAIHDGDATFLLQLDDPLDRMSNRWISENGLDTVHKDELLHCVESLRAEQALGRPMSEVFQQRIKENYDQFLKDWEQLDVQTLINKSAEITATRKCFHGLCSMGFTDSELQYLLQFQNPLEMVRDQYLDRTESPVFKPLEVDDLEILMEHLLDTRDLDGDYPLVTEQQSFTVRDFISAHPGEAFHLITPGGYVDLTAAQAEELLAGQSVSGHPGCPGYDREVTAEELLPQVIANCNYHEGAWNIISGYSQLEESNIGMEVTMC